MPFCEIWTGYGYRGRGARKGNHGNWNGSEAHGRDLGREGRKGRGKDELPDIVVHDVEGLRTHTSGKIEGSKTLLCPPFPSCPP